MDKRIANAINRKIQDCINELEKYKQTDILITQLKETIDYINDCYFIWDKKGGEQ